MECMMAYGGNNLINMVIAKVYAAQRNSFRGSGTSSGLAYTFDVTQVPVATLVANNTSRNLEINLRVAITARGGVINFNQTLPMRANGRIGMRQGNLSLTRLSVATTSTSPIDQIVVGLINSQVIPKIRTTLLGIPIPQLDNVFGSSLSASLRTGKVISGPALEVGARIEGRTRIPAADAPTAANIRSLNSGSATDALMIALVSGGAANTLVSAVTPALSHRFDKRGSRAKFGGGIRGTIRATIPDLQVRNGRGNISTTISFSGLQGGIKIPIKGWTWVSLPAPGVNIAITHTLTSSSNTGFIRLTGVSDISVSFSWPTVLKPVEVLLKSLLNGILRLFRGMISSAVRGKRFELFRLPRTIPGTNLRSTLSFATGGLSYYKSSVQTILRIRG